MTKKKPADKFNISIDTDSFDVDSHEIIRFCGCVGKRPRWNAAMSLRVVSDKVLTTAERKHRDEFCEAIVAAVRKQLLKLADHAKAAAKKGGAK